MSSEISKKPFYLFPPWNILFEFNKLEKLVPWNINIAFLLRSFLENMNKTGEVDFRASGVALDSSALIYLMKSKLLLKLEEPPPPPKPPLDFLPPPLFLPLRHELTSTTIRNLLEVLDDVLKGEQFIRAQPIAIESILPTPSEIMPQLDIFLMEIEAQMEKLYAMIAERVKGDGHRRVFNFDQRSRKTGGHPYVHSFTVLGAGRQSRSMAERRDGGNLHSYRRPETWSKRRTKRLVSQPKKKRNTSSKGRAVTSSLAEAALYVAGRPLDLNDLCSVLKTRSKNRARRTIDKLMQEYVNEDTALGNS